MAVNGVKAPYSATVTLNAADTETEARLVLPHKTGMWEDLPGMWNSTAVTGR